MKYKFSLRLRKNSLLLGALYVFAILINIAYRRSIPITAAIHSPHDDQLGVELAANLLSGDWLGTWNNRTLAKPPGYSIFLAFVHFSPLQIAVINQLVFIILVGLFLIQIEKYLVCGPGFKAASMYIVFVFLIFQPILFNPDANRIYRSSLTMLNLTFVFAILLIRVFEKINNVKGLKELPIKSKIEIHTLLSALSLTYASMTLFRYESYWILLCTLPLLLLLLLSKSRSLGRRNESGRAFFRFLMPIPVLVVAVYSLPIIAIQEANKSKYGVPLTENYFQGSFPEAVNLWSSIDVGRDPRPYVIVSAAQRNAVYEISTTAALLKPFLEKKDSGWHSPPCAKFRLCDNAGAWFTWQVRDAAVQTGLVYSERTFQQFFQRISDDIKSFCEVSRFNCRRKSNLVGFKPLQEISKKQLIQVSLKNFQVLLPLNFQERTLFLGTDNFGAPNYVVDLNHRVVKYPNSDSYEQGNLDSASKLYSLISNVYIVLNWLIFLLASLGIAMRWRRGLTTDFKLVFAFLFMGVTSQLIGASIAHITFGTTPTALYILSAYPLLQLFNVLGTLCFINYLRTIKSNDSKVDFKSANSIISEKSIL